MNNLMIQLPDGFRDIVKERRNQDKKWGEQNHDDYTWHAILTEEIGEVSQAILHDRFGGAAAGTVRAELVQVAAVALAWIECIDRRLKTLSEGEEGRPIPVQPEKGT
jgi:NTP pyrophosphatase (non-canonical NTP hydrolase)